MRNASLWSWGFWLVPWTWFFRLHPPPTPPFSLVSSCPSFLSDLRNKREWGGSPYFWKPLLISQSRPGLTLGPFEQHRKLSRRKVDLWTLTDVLVQRNGLVNALCHSCLTLHRWDESSPLLSFSFLTAVRYCKRPLSKDRKRKIFLAACVRTKAVLANAGALSVAVVYVFNSIGSQVEEKQITTGADLSEQGLKTQKRKLSPKRFRHPWGMTNPGTTTLFFTFF